MDLSSTETIFLLSTLLGTIGLIIIIYSRVSEAKKSKLFILTLFFIIGYLISHTIHFIIMKSEDVTILDMSCHSFLLIIIVALTFFTWNFPRPQKMGITRSLMILLPSLSLFVLLWTGNLVQESHAHMQMFEAHYSYYYPIFLIWYVLLIGLNVFWLVRKFNVEEETLYKKQVLLFLTGLIITNLTSFIFGLFLPWYLGFYYLVEISPLAFLAGVILFTSVAVSKFEMFPSTLGKLHRFSLNKKIILSASILVPLIILLVQVPLIRLVFNMKSNEELSRYFIISVFGGIIVSVSIAFVIIKIISNPLNKLRKKIQEIEKGNYGIRIETNTADEIGELTNAFNNLSESLKNQKELEEQLFKSEKLAALGKMAAVLAHEIKTPLTSIKLNADIFAETLELKDDEKESLEIIQKEINRLDKLVKEVLQFSRQMELDFTMVNLYDLIENIKCQLNGKLKEKRISFINSIHNVELNADVHKLKQVFLNLIDNSIEAINGNGIIKISSIIEEKQSDEKSLKIFILDTGPGLKSDINIFEPFFTTKASGTGLGLSIARKIIEQHRGSITLLSSEQGKTIFEVILPFKKVT